LQLLLNTFKRSKIPSRKPKKPKRLSKAQTVGIPITVDMANADTDADTPADIDNINSDTYTMPAPSAILIETTVSTIAQEELYVSDSDKEQEYLNDAAIFLNNYSNKDVSSTEIQTAEDPAAKLTSQDSASQYNTGLSDESTSKLLFLLAISKVMLIYISQTRYYSTKAPSTEDYESSFSRLRGPRERLDSPYY
jgi:hypothetical protein